MKKIITLFNIFFLSLFICFTNVKDVHAGTSPKNNEALQNGEYNNEKLIKTQNMVVSKAQMLNYQDKSFNIVYECENKIYLSNFNNTTYLFDGYLVGAIDQGEKLYICVNRVDGVNIYIYDKKETSYFAYSYIGITGNQFGTFKEGYYICGSKEKDACLIILDNVLEIQDEIICGGDGYESFVSCVLFDDDFMLIGEKDGISNNGPFPNSGNVDDIKAFLSFFSYEFEMENVICFNENTNKESLRFNYQNKNLIYLSLFYLDGIKDLFLDTNTKEVFELGERERRLNDFTIYSNKTNNALLYLTGNVDNLQLVSKNYEYNFENSGFVLDYRVFLGKLFILAQDGNELKLIEFEEYEKEIYGPLICSKVSYNLDDMSHFKIESFFDTYKVEIEEISPYFEKRLCGTYDILYKAKRSDNTSINLETKLIVKEYTNFIDGGFYNKGKVLTFFGDGYLDGKHIFSGYTMTQTGLYKLEIKDINGNIKNYSINIVDDYYYNNDCEYIPYDNYAIIHEENMVKFKLNKFNFDIYDIVDVVVNGEISTEFNLIDNNLFIGLTSFNKCDLKEDYINGFHYVDDKEDVYYYELNKSILSKGIKETPTITCDKTLENKKIKTIFNIVDNYQSFSYLKVSYKDSKDVLVYKIFYRDFKLEDITTNMLKIDLYYELGDGNINKVNLIDFQSSSKDNKFDEISISCKVEYQKDTLSSLSFEFNNIKNNKKNNCLIVSGDDISSLYNVKTPNFILPIVIISCGIVVVIGVIIIIKIIILNRKKKRESF